MYRTKMIIVVFIYLQIIIVYVTCSYTYIQVSDIDISATHILRIVVYCQQYYMSEETFPWTEIKVCLCCSLIIFCHLQLNGKEDSCLILSTHNVLLIVPSMHLRGI